MKKYNIEITFENGVTKELKNMSEVLIKVDNIYQLMPIEEMLRNTRKLKPYAFLGTNQRFDFIKLKDAIYVHYSA